MCRHFVIIVITLLSLFVTINFNNGNPFYYLKRSSPECLLLLFCICVLFVVHKHFEKFVLNINCIKNVS